jgi:hypothetical protein
MPAPAAAGGLPAPAVAAAAAQASAPVPTTAAPGDAFLRLEVRCKAVSTTRLAKIALTHTLHRMLGRAGAADTLGLRQVQARVASTYRERFLQKKLYYQE